MTINLNDQFQFPLISASYDPDARRLVALSELGNLECGSGGETIPVGTFSLRLDGINYRLSDVQLGQQVFQYHVNTGTFEVRLTRLDELVGQQCQSSGVTGANLRLRIDDEPPLSISQGVIYRTGAPRRLEVRVSDPLICFDFGGAAPGLRFDVTDPNDETWSVQGVELARYATGTGTVEVGLPSTASCFGFAGGGPGPVAGGVSPDALFATGFEIHEIYPDLEVAIVELPSALEQVFRYRIEVTNLRPYPAQNVRLRDFYPKTGVPRFVDALVNWTCSAQGAGATCGSLDEGGGRVDLAGAALPAYLPTDGGPPRLVITVERTYAEYELGLPVSVQAAVTIAPPGLPDRDRNNNSTNLGTVVSEPAGPVAADDLFQTDQDSGVAGNVFLDNGSGPDIHLNGLGFDVVAINGNGADVGATVELRAAPPGGAAATVTVQANGAMSFDPGDAFVAVPGGESDSASFTYTIRDIDNLTSTGLVTIEVAGFNDPPVAGDMEFDVPLSGAFFAVPGVLGESSDPDGDALSVVAVNGASFISGLGFLLPSTAILTMNSNGGFGYSPPIGSSAGGNDSFDITVSDGEFQGVARITIQFVP